MRRRPSPPSPRRTHVLELTIAELSQGGRGVGVHTLGGERRAVFVPDVALHERVRVEADFSKRPAEGRLLEVLEASPERVSPPCTHVARCGGCDWMHLSARARRDAHAAMVKAILPPAFRAVEVHAHDAVGPLGYRTRARLHVEARRSEVLVGMHGRRSHEPVRVDTCVVLDPRLDRARDALASWLEGARGKGEARLSLGRPGPDRKPVLDLRFEGALPAELFGRLERAVATGALDGARVFDGDVRVPATIGDPTSWIEGPDGVPLRLAPGGFSQATEAGNRQLSQRVASLADELAPNDASTVELYAGAGNLTVLLARARRVVAVESDEEACAAAQSNLRERALSARIVHADASTHPIDRAAKLVVLDPPRAGAREVIAALAARPVPAVIYVSCNPPTLGRDLATLADAGFALRSIETFEMFPQTSHVETVAALTHTKARA